MLTQCHPLGLKLGQEWKQRVSDLILLNIMLNLIHSQFWDVSCVCSLGWPVA